MNVITIIDTGICNVTSVVNAFTRFGFNVNITNSKADVETASVLVLPGVGAYKHGMDALSQYELVDVLRERVLSDKVPIIGICLGMQLLAETSFEHGVHSGLGLISGQVVALEPKDENYRVPNIGWCDVISDKESVMFPSNIQDEIHYHVHSYHLVSKDKADIAAHIKYDKQDITVAIERGNIFGMQFHPEKSQDDGLNLLSRVVNSFSNS